MKIFPKEIPLNNCIFQPTGPLNRRMVIKTRLHKGLLIECSLRYRVKDQRTPVTMMMILPYFNRWLMNKQIRPGILFEVTRVRHLNCVHRLSIYPSVNFLSLFDTPKLQVCALSFIIFKNPEWLTKFSQKTSKVVKMARTLLASFYYS